MSLPSDLSSSQHFSVSLTMADSIVVPFLSMPSCALQHCVKSNSSALPCPTLTTPCRQLLGASPTRGQLAESPGKTMADFQSLCTTVPLSCYCDLASPLQCAWESCGIGAQDPSDWLRAEDWFNETCPNAALIPFDGNASDKKLPLPDCARECLQNRSFDSGCIIEKKVCFCPPRTLFGCAAPCSTAENATLARWYSDTCAVSLEDATAALRRMDGFWPVIPAMEPLRPGLEWYELLVLVVLSLIITAGLVYLAVRERLRKLHQKHIAQRKRQ